MKINTYDWRAWLASHSLADGWKSSPVFSRIFMVITARWASRPDASSNFSVVTMATPQPFFSSSPYSTLSATAEKSSRFHQWFSILQHFSASLSFSQHSSAFSSTFSQFLLNFCSNYFVIQHPSITVFQLRPLCSKPITFSRDCPPQSQFNNFKAFGCHTTALPNFQTSLFTCSSNVVTLSGSAITLPLMCTPPRATVIWDADNQ